MLIPRFHVVQHGTKRRMFSRAQPLKRHHLGGHQLGSIAGQTVKRRVPITLAARAAGIGYHPHVKFFLQQTQSGFALDKHALRNQR